MKLTKIITLALLALFLLSIVSLSLVSVSALVIKSVSMNPAEIEPGETAVIEIEIENDGDNDIKDVVVNLDLSGVIISEVPGVPSTLIYMPFALSGSSSQDSFNEIEEDEDETARFKIMALSKAKSDVYNIPVKIKYTENDVVKKDDSLISVRVNSPPVIDVSFEDSLLLKGENEEIELRIINKGLSDVTFVEVELGSSVYFDLLTKKIVYIGDVDSDDFDSVKFNVFFKKKTPDKINLPVIVRYKDATNQDIEKTFSIPLNVYTKERAIELGLMEKDYKWVYGGIVVVLIVGFFCYRKFRKWRRMKINERKRV